MTDAVQASGQFMRAAERATTLYELSDEYVHLVALLEDDEVDPHLVEQELDRVSGEIKHKAEAIGGLVRWYEGLAELRRSESKRMAETVGTFERRAERLRAYLLKHMQAMREATGNDRIDTARYTFKISQNPPKVEVLEAMLVPSEFNRTRINIEPDKTAIREHWRKTGEIVPGTEITRSERLDIR